MTKYVVSGYIGFDNFGDEAIAKILVSYLKSTDAEKITYISSNPQKTSQTLEVTSVRMLDFVKPILESDVLISGGGSLLQDITSLKSLIYYLVVILTALLFGKKVVIFAQGFTPFRTKLGKFFTKLILKYCDKISVRDFQSQEYLWTMGISSKLVSDPVFALEIPHQEKKEIGIQLRNNSYLTDSFLNKLAKEIAQNFPDKEIKLISLQDNLDLEVLNKFKNILEEAGVKSIIIKNLGVNEAVQTISSLEYLIAMRFHACLIGVKANVKTLGINYDIKVEKLSQETGFPILNFEENDMINKFNELKKLNPHNYHIPTFKFEDII